MPKLCLSESDISKVILINDDFQDCPKLVFKIVPEVI